MRVAFVGKGGSGKSLIAGTLTRVLAQRGHRILALDVDTMPGFAYSLGLDPDTAMNAILPEYLGVRDDKRGWILREGANLAELVEQYAAHAPDNIRFLQLGKLPGRVKPGSTTAFRYVLEEYRAEGLSLIGDLAAGTRQPFFGWSDFAEIVLLVVEPMGKSMLAARRLAKLAQERPSGDDEKTEPVKPRVVGIVANKIREERELEQIQNALQEISFPLLAVIPFDIETARAEQKARAPIDAAPNAAAVMAIKELATRLEELNGVVHSPNGV